MIIARLNRSSLAMMPPPSILGGSSEASVQGTNDDAQVSKLSCSRLGYFKDDFIHFFVKKASRRSPLINRGYYSRHAALRKVFLSFLKSFPRPSEVVNEGGGHDGSTPTPSPSPIIRGSQVLVLGAGFDTTWWQVMQDLPPHLRPLKYLEVDYKEVTRRKAAIIAKHPELHLPLRPSQPSQPSSSSPPLQHLQHHTPTTPATPATQSGEGLQQGLQQGGGGRGGEGSGSALHIDVQAGEVVSDGYSLLPVDLRDLEGLGRVVERSGLSWTQPTYILSECVLVYMEPRDSAAVVSWAARSFQGAARMVVYEQINPHDAFGRQMCLNLESRGCGLRGLLSTPTLGAHEKRMTDGGWEKAESRSMDDLYKGSWLDPEEKRRAEAIEMFDEFEEWHMIQEHYAITVGAKGSSEDLFKDHF